MAEWLVNTEYDRAKVPPYNGHDPRPPSGEKEYTPPPWHPSFLCLLPEVTHQKSLWSIHHFPGKTRKGAYNIGPERGVYTTRPQTRKKEKKRVSTVVVYAFFFLAGSPKAPSVSNPMKRSTKQGDTRGASEVRHGTSSIYFLALCRNPRNKILHVVF